MPIRDRTTLIQVAAHVLGLSRTEDELRQWLCTELGCTSVRPAGLTVQGQVDHDAFLLPVRLGAPGADPTEPITMQLDTGAFEPLLTLAVAEALQLPNEGPLEISGVTGSSSAYASHMSVALVGTDGQVQQWLSVACTVDPSFTGTPLLGLRFFIEAKLQLTLDPVNAQLIVAEVRS
jgi:hypothetical protein